VSAVVRVAAAVILRADGAVLFGLTDSDPGFGLAAGFTYVFDAFTLP
jgi:hypothetical protein